MKSIVYSLENDLSVDEFKKVLEASTLAERRPVNDHNRLELMLRHANIILTARCDGVLIGVARSLTDFAFCTYLSDLAVHADFQKQGIGIELIRRTKLASRDAKLILLAAPKAVDYYPRIGMKKHDHCYFIDDADQLRN